MGASLQRKFIAALALATIAVPARADDWFKVKPADTLAGIRRNIDRLEAIAPLPDPKCGLRGLTTNCNARLTAAVRFQLVETPDGRSANAIRSHIDGQPGAVLQVSASYDPAIGTPADGAVVDAVCTAILMTFQPRLSPAAATDIYLTAMRRAANATATGRAGIGRSFHRIPRGTFMVEAEQLNIRCVAAARDQSAFF